VVIDRLAVTIEPLINRKYITTSARKKTTDYRNTRIKNKQEQKRLIKTSLITIQKNTLIIALRNDSNNILLNTRKEIIKI
jgi:hypothetical protein